MKYLYLIILSLCLFACEKTQDQGELKVGISADYPPFDMVINGEVTGLDADVAKFIAEHLGKKLVIKEMDFASLMPALDSGIIDLAISNITKTSEREKNYDFSIPYYQSKTVLVTKNPTKKHFADFKYSKIGVQAGSFFETKLNELSINNKPMTRISMMIEDLKSGNVEAIILDEVIAENILEKYTNFYSVDVSNIKGVEVAIALKKASNLTEKVNEAIKESITNGHLEQLYNKWLFETQISDTEAQTTLGIENRYFYIIGEGASLTIQFALISTLCGLIIAIVLTIIAYISKIGLFFTNIYVSILRGTPLILQLSLIYFALPGMLDIKISVFTAGIIAFSINSAAYVFEHLKAGINSVDKGQIEAASSIGLSKMQTMRLIVIPQAFRNVVPSLINEAINLVKESSIISVIGAQDIMRKAQIISSETYDYMTPLMIAGLYYYLIINLLNLILVQINKKLAR